MICSLAISRFPCSYSNFDLNFSSISPTLARFSLMSLEFSLLSWFI